jgi:hypothetical protein
MDYQYHRNDLKKYQKEPYIQTALSMLDEVEFAMQNFVSGKISTEQYIEQITPYDKFVWEKYIEKPQGTNVFNSKQKKKNSSWREQKWASIFEIVRQTLQNSWSDVNLILIQNCKVVETIYSSGYIGHKNVDGGIGIKTKEGIIPVVVVEDKAGNICSTTFNGINAQGWRLHQSFPNAKYILITDNEFNVGEKKGAEIGNDVNMVVLERGQYRVKEHYPQLNWQRFDSVKTKLINELTKIKPEHFLQYEIIQSKTTGRLTDSLNDGIIWNW